MKSGFKMTFGQFQAREQRYCTVVTINPYMFALKIRCSASETICYCLR